MAIALHQKSVPCQIFESRSPSAPELSSGIVLTPNGLKILDYLGVFDRIKDRCWQSEYRTYKNDKDETLRKSLVASKALYGYCNHRLWRPVLLFEMKAVLMEQCMPIIYNAKFEGVVSDDSDAVTFSINGAQHKTSMLVGADGIYSSVRKHVAPNIVPEYTGTTGVLGHINRDTVQWPYDDYEKACTIQGKPGAFFMIPEVKDGSEIMVGMQVKHPDQNRAEWDALAADKDKLCAFYTRGYDEWHGTARQIIDSVCRSKESLYLWPFLKMPKIERWYSPTGRVVIVGDCAHAIPPSSGQGTNQALEDVYALTKLLGAGRDLLATLKFWQEMRQKRIDAVSAWATGVTNTQRLPQAEREKLVLEGKVVDANKVQDYDDMRWLYHLDADEVIDAWINS